jgi:hypothetical protein
VRAELFVAIVGLVVPIIVGTFMALYPNSRWIGWLVIAVSMAVFTAALVLYLYSSYSAYFFAFGRPYLLTIAAALGFFISISAMLFFDPGSYRNPYQAVRVKSGVKLQFFGGNKIPTQVSIDNVATWFTYFTPSLSILPKDAKGNTIAGGMEVPPNWVIFVAFDHPVLYGEVRIDFSNPEIMPVMDRQMMNSRVVVISSRGPIPAGVLDIHVEN